MTQTTRPQAALRGTRKGPYATRGLKLTETAGSSNDIDTASAQMPDLTPEQQHICDHATD